MQVQPLDLENLLEKGMAAYSSILAWRIPRTEEAGGLHSGEPGVSGDFWGSQEGCQGPSREEGNPAGLSSCSGGLRPLVELCVEPAGSFNLWIGKIPRRRKWQPTPVFLPGESHGQRSLVPGTLGNFPGCL